MPIRALAACAVDIFEHSQYFADQLIRHPELLEELSRACESPEFRLDAGIARRRRELRRFFRSRCCASSARASSCDSPIFTTLERTSDLADAVIAAAYRIALDEVKAASPPASAAYHAADQMMVIALGRLGMREFDLASDADLVFVTPRRGRARAPLLDRRGRAHDRRHQRLHRRGRDLHGGYAAAAERARRRAGAVRSAFTRITSPNAPKPGKASPT